MTTATKPLVPAHLDTSSGDTDTDLEKRFYSHERAAQLLIGTLCTTTDLAARGVLYGQLADITSDQAALYAYAEDDPDVYRAGLAELTTTVRLLRHTANAETSSTFWGRKPLTRSDGRYAWPDLEVAAGWLLDEICRHPFTNLAHLYEEIADILVGRRYVTPGEAEILLTLADTHRTAVGA